MNDRMRVLIDTNIVLDVLLKRDPWQSQSSALWRAVDEAKLSGWLAASVMTDIFYVARRLTDVMLARKAVQVCLDAFQIAPVDRTALERALQFAGFDYEDNVLIACAEANELDAVVTRNTIDFKDSPVPVWSPAECLDRLKSGKHKATDQDEN